MEKENEKPRDPICVEVNGVKVFSAEYVNWDTNVQKKWIDRLDTMVRVSLTIHAVEIAVVILLAVRMLMT